MMNGVDSGGGMRGGSAGSHASQLARMRVAAPHLASPGPSPSTPITPVAPTPSYLIGLGEENVMEDLQLAAELGKTLLERNRELEGSLRHQQTVIEDQLQEIEYLSKQTAALREVNDSRLRIYEQLEVSIQELEKNNQRLSAEGQADKRKIKSLTNTLESLETRCEELQRQLQQQQQQQQQQRGRSKKKSLILEDQLLRRSLSCEAPAQSCEEEEEEETRRALVEEAEGRVREVRRSLDLEVRKREEVEIQLACLTQENAVLQEQLNVLRAREEGVVRSLEDELASLDDSSSSRLCRKCLGEVETASNPTLYDLTDSIEDTDASIESVHGECALIRLKNGGYAWGSQESLASIGHVVGGGSGGTSPGGGGGGGGTETSGDAPHNSLLSELDTSYRILIEKYEALLEAREQQEKNMVVGQQNTSSSLAPHNTLIHPGVDDLSGPMSLVMTENLHEKTLTDVDVGGRCQRCKTCTCDMKGTADPRPKSNLLEEFSEVETSSSGFSDGESRTSNKSTQTAVTEEETLSYDFLATPTPKCLNLSSPVNPCDRRFQAAPEYKKLFQEIFTVLKKTVDENDGNKDNQNQQQLLQQQQNILHQQQNTQEEQKIQQQQQQQNIEWQEDIQQQENIHPNQTSQKQHQEDTYTSTPAPDTQRGEVLSEIIPEESGNNAGNLPSAPVSKKSSDGPERKRDECSKGEFEGRRKSRKKQQPEQEEEEKERARENHPDTFPITKPHRPDSLDLISNHSGSSRPSSRQKRRRQRQAQRLQQQLVLNNSNHSFFPQQPQQNRHHHRRDHHHQPPPHLKQEDFPNFDIQSEGGEGGAGNRTRVFYNSRGRCEHHRSRKHRERKHQHQQQQQSDLETRSSTTTTGNGNSAAPPKINFPSVEVAKLRKLEMTYAEALKHSMSRSHYNRRY